MPQEVTICPSFPSKDSKMLCKWCQIKVVRNCIMAKGGFILMDTLPCDFRRECDADSYSKKIIEIFITEENEDLLD
jgi:hypothetical protein